MRTLEKVDEFRREAGNAIFTRQQAMAVTLQLLTQELRDGDNTDQEAALLEKAIAKVDIKYIDATETATDLLLDSFNVARFSATDILKAIEDILFDLG